MNSWPDTANIVFLLLLATGIGLFAYRMRQIIALIKMGRST